jgi:site-specific recombinase XerC
VPLQLAPGVSLRDRVGCVVWEVPPKSLVARLPAGREVLPFIGGEKLSAVTTSDLQVLVDRWQGEGQPASTIRNSLKPLQAIYRRATARAGLPINPTSGLELPAPRPKEVEIVSPEIAAKMLAALPAEDQPL